MSADDTNASVDDTEALVVPVGAAREDPPFPFAPSVVVLGCVGLVDAIEYGIVMPSLSKYLEEVYGSSSSGTYGLVLALFSATSLCVKPFVGTWSDRRTFKEVYVITIAIAIVGASTYALARHFSSLGMLLVGRMLGGVGAANTSLLYAYVSRTVPPERQSKIMMMAGMTFPVGMVLGPCSNLITATADFTVAGVYVDDSNAPGFFLATVLSVLLMALLVVLREPPAYTKAQVKEQKGFLKDVFREVKKPGILLCLLVIFAFNMFIAATEAVVVPVTQHAAQLHFSPLQNSYVYAGVATLLLILSIMIMTFGSKVSDRGLVLFATVFYASSSVAVMFLWDYSMSLWRFIIGEGLLVSAIPFSFSPNRALFSKIVKGSTHQGLLSSLLSIMASVGAICGPLWMGLTAGSSDQESGPVAHKMFYGFLAMCALLFVLILVIWFGTDPPPIVDVPAKQPKKEDEDEDVCADDENPLGASLLRDPPQASPHSHD